MKKKILLTNDDGISSKGLEQLYRTLCDDFEIFTIAPHVEQSGVGHSFTYQNTLFLHEHTGGFADTLFSLTGSPADCVKFAISKLLPEYPDIVVSGLNIGENSGISSYYSGTVAGAREGAFWRIRSFAFSLCSESYQYAEEYLKMVPDIIRQIHSSDMVKDKKVYFNVNFPPCPPSDVKGIKITRQSMAYFQDDYRCVSSNTSDGYRIFGEKVNIEESEDFDSRALLNGWVTITPHSFDSTSYEQFNALKNRENEFSIKGVCNE
jgi:5'-nucleotidase